MYEEENEAHQNNNDPQPWPVVPRDIEGTEGYSIYPLYTLYTHNTYVHMHNTITSSVLPSVSITSINEISHRSNI